MTPTLPICYPFAAVFVCTKVPPPPLLLLIQSVTHGNVEDLESTERKAPRVAPGGPRTAAKLLPRQWQVHTHTHLLRRISECTMHNGLVRTCAPSLAADQMWAVCEDTSKNKPRIVLINGFIINGLWSGLNLFIYPTWNNCKKKKAVCRKSPIKATV